MGSSFHSFTLNNNILTFEGISYLLNGTNISTDENLSSFKVFSMVDNGNNTVTLTVGANSIVVAKFIVQTNALLTNTGDFIIDSNDNVLTHSG